MSVMDKISTELETTLKESREKELAPRFKELRQYKEETDRNVRTMFIVGYGILFAGMLALAFLI